MICEQKQVERNEDGTEYEVPCENHTKTLTKNIPTCRECRDRLRQEKAELDIPLEAMSLSELIQYRNMTESDKINQTTITQGMKNKFLKKQVKKQMGIGKWGLSLSELKDLTERRKIANEEAANADQSQETEG